MISEFAVLWLGTMAFVALLIGVLMGQREAGNTFVATISLVFGLLFWISFALYGQGYKVYEGASAFDAGSMALTVIGLVGTVLTVVLLFDAAFRTFK